MRQILIIIMASIGAILTVHAADDGQVATSIYLGAITLGLLVMGRRTHQKDLSDIRQVGRHYGGLGYLPQVGERFEVVREEASIPMARTGDIVEVISDDGMYTTVASGAAIFVQIEGRHKAMLSMLDKQLKLRKL